ncbi:hypothetical protein ACKI2N_029030 [Cupriavidus sp. 30B13]|uniref:hypothetical protein n=1 Tax=Cupriavidus sp. 30B13 TaxID=3384241 RepID=UPI003B90EDA8
MKKILFLLISISFPAQATECQTNANFIIHDIYSDPDYKQFVCANNDCPIDYFANSITIYQESLGSDVIGCFATPIRKARNFYTGFYVIKEGKIRPQFIFFGTWLTPKKDTHASPTPLVGIEYIEAGELERHQFSWNGRDYLETQTKEK